VSEVLAVEPDSSTKKENKKPEIINAPPKRGMLDQSQFDEQQNQIISRMLQRTTLYKEDSSEEEPETEDWVCYYIF
jgi:hypothetical protein